MSMTSLHRIAVDSVERLNFRRVRLILRLAFVAPKLGGSRTRCAAHPDHGTGNRHRVKEVTTTNQRFSLLVHGNPSINLPSPFMHLLGKRNRLTVRPNYHHLSGLSHW